MITTLRETIDALNALLAEIRAGQLTPEQISDRYAAIKWN